MLATISLIVSIASFGFSFWTWKSQGKHAQYQHLEYITYANHAVFSYNSKRQKSERFFLLGPTIEVDLDILNPSSLPLTVYSFQLIAHGSDKFANFQLLTQETLAGDMVKDRLAGGASPESMSAGMLNVIRLIPNDVVIVPPYGTYRLTTIFQGYPDAPDTFTDFEFRFRSVSKNPFSSGFEDQTFHLEISDYPKQSKRTTEPGKLVPPQVLKQLDSSL